MRRRLRQRQGRLAQRNADSVQIAIIATAITNLIKQ
jgi:hypothetical protein